MPIRIISRCLTLVVFIFITHFSNISYAQYVRGPVATGAGGAGVAAHDEAEQIFMNPALIIHAKSFAVGYFYADGYLDKSEHDKWIGITITDNTEEIFLPGSFSYIQRKRTFPGQGPWEERFFQLAVAFGISEGFAGGVSLYHMIQDVADLDTYKYWNMKAGLHYNPIPDLGWGFVYNNFLKSNDEAPRFYRPKSSLSAGVNYLFMPRFRGRFDITRQLGENRKGRFKLQGGVESFLDAFLVFRMGLEDDQLLKRKYGTLGLGFAGPRLQVDYSYKKNFEYSSGALHGVDFRMPF